MTSRIGRRGAALLLLAALWFLIGYGVLDGGMDPRHDLPIEHLALWLRTAIWWAGAVVATVTAFWPPGRTLWGFIALVVPVAFRTASYLVAVLFGDFDLFVELGAWVIVTSLVIVLAGWAEPPRRP